MGPARSSAPLPALVLAAALAVSASARAGEPSAMLQADIRRAFAAVGPSSSAQPALRQERQTREPSAGFVTGAALGAWINAAVLLDFDLKNPSAAGPPHASQGAANTDAIADDCAQEEAAFDSLAAASQALGLGPGQVLDAAGLKDSPGVAVAWLARARGPVQACR